MSESEAVPAAVQVTARALRAAASWVGQTWAGVLRTAADATERDWAGACCPVCEEVRCDAGCPLEELRTGLAQLRRGEVVPATTRAEELVAAAEAGAPAGPDPAAGVLRRLLGQATVCGSTPPQAPGEGPWGDCWCTRGPGHTGDCVCEICQARHGAPGWPGESE